MNNRLQPERSCSAAVTRSARTRQRGHAMVEVALLAPWIFFLFIGILDVGFYSYALMAVDNAARAAALQTSIGIGTAGDSTLACFAAIREMQSLPNVYNKFNCAASAGGVTQSTPVFAQATANTARSPDISSIVTVTYAAVPLVPIPGVLTGQMTITRTAEIRVGN